MLEMTHRLRAVGAKAGQIAGAFVAPRSWHSSFRQRDVALVKAWAQAGVDGGTVEREAVRGAARE
jgi:hypothetical protein